MICAICYRAPRGFYYMPLNYVAYPELVKAFCSKRCQDIYYSLQQGSAAVNPKQYEQKAREATLPKLAERLKQIDANKPVAHFNREEVLSMVDTILGAYHETLQTLCEKETLDARL